MTKYDAVGVEELEAGACKIVTIAGKSIGVYYNGKEYYAIAMCVLTSRSSCVKGSSRERRWNPGRMNTFTEEKARF